MTKSIVGTLELKDLKLDTVNVRQSHSTESLKTLAKNIAAGGIHQPLLVRKKGKSYRVVAGGRRLAALNMLVEAGTIQNTYLVPVKFFSGSEAEAVEASQAENTHRKEMTEIEFIVAFGAMHRDGKGLSVEDIASRYNMNERRVRAMLALCGLPKEALEAAKDETLSIRALELLASCPYETRKIEALGRIGDFNNNMRALKEFLMPNEMQASHGWMNIVGLSTYTAAGGTLRADLFAKDEDKIVENGDLLENLVGEAINLQAQTLRDEGWLKVETVAQGEHFHSYNLNEMQPEMSKLSDEDAAKVEELNVLNSVARKGYDSSGEEAIYGPFRDEMRRCSNQIEKISEAYRAYSDAQRKAAKVFVYVDNNTLKSFFSTTASETGEKQKAPKADYSKKLVARLLDTKSYGAKQEVLSNPKVAKALLVAALIGGGYASERSVEINNGNGMTYWGKDEKIANTALYHKASKAVFDRYGVSSNNSQMENLGILLPMADADLDNLLAAVTADALNFNKGYAGQPDDATDMDTVCEAINLDMTQHYKVDEELLTKLSMAVIEKAVAEVGTKKETMKVRVAKTKKLTVIAALPILQSYNWLPPLFARNKTVNEDVAKAA